MCGDSTSVENIKQLLNGNSPTLLLTDPPYNFEYSGAGIIKDRKKAQQRLAPIMNFDANTIAFLSKMDIPSIYLFCNKALIPDYLRIFDDWNFNILVWEKTGVPPFTKTNYMSDVEYLMYFHKAGRVFNTGLRPIEVYKKVYHSNAREGKIEAGGDFHPTIKPIGMLSNQIRVSSNVGDVVLDMFGGSGSTMIACEQLGRKCYMMELDTHYCDVIISRWEKLTGQTAVKIK